MAISFEGSIARLCGQCAVEEAGELTEWLLADRSRRIDLSGCEGLHAAVLQTIMALRPPMVAGLTDSALSRWLGPVLPPAAASAPATDAIVQCAANLPRETPRAKRPRAKPVDRAPAAATPTKRTVRQRRTSKADPA